MQAKQGKEKATFGDESALAAACFRLRISFGLFEHEFQYKDRLSQNESSAAG